MKKFILFVLVCIILSGCGGGSAQPAADNGSGSQTSNDAQESQIIHFDDVVVFENDDLKITLTDFYTEDVNWSDGAATESIVNFKIKVKGDKDMLINLWANLDDEKAYACMWHGSNKYEAGKSSNCTYLIKREAVPKEKPLESLDELYDLNGTFEVDEYTSDNKLKEYGEIEFDLRDVVHR